MKEHTFSLYFERLPLNGDRLVLCDLRGRSHDIRTPERAWMDADAGARVHVCIVLLQRRHSVWDQFHHKVGLF